MNVQEHTDGFRKWIDESDIFDMNIWWAPNFDQGFTCYSNWEQQMEDYKQFGIRGGIVTSYDSAFVDPYIGNARTASLLKGYEGFYGCMVVTPEMGYTADKGKAYIQEMIDQGFVAARMFPKTYIHSMENYAIGAVLDTLEALHIPLLLWHTEATWDHMDRICSEHPDLTVIVEGHDRKLLYHARDYVGLMRKHSNFFVETHNLVLYRDFESIDKYCGCGQLIYGSYFPYMTPYFSLYPVYKAVISEEDQRGILAGNAKKIFNL